MSGLLDLAPVTEEVVLGPGPKQRLVVSGLTVEDIFFLVKTFPEVKALLERRLKDITPEKLMDAAPRTLAAIIACATEERDNEQAIKAAMRIPADGLLKTLNVVFRLTFPDGVGPFVKNLMALQGSFGASGTVGRSTGTLNGESAALATPYSTPISAALDMDAASSQHYGPRRAH